MSWPRVPGQRVPESFPQLPLDLRTTRTSVSGCPSTVTDRTPRPAPAGFSTRIRYVADR